MAQWPRAQEATCSGWASVGGREQNRVDHLGGPPPAAAALVDGSGAADPDHLGGAGQVDPRGRLDRFDGAPYPAPVGAVGDGDGGHVLPGQLLQLPFQARLVVLDRQEVVGAAGDDPLGGAPLGVHGVCGDQGPVQVQGGEQLGQGGDLVGLVRHSALSHDHSARLVQGRQEVGAGLSPVRAPRMVLPSTAITLRPPMAPTRVRSQDATLASRSSAFTRSSTLRMVDSLGRARPSSRSRAPGRPVPGRRRARASPPAYGTPPGPPPPPGTRPRSGSGAPRACPADPPRLSGPPSGAGATGRLWWMMTWRRDPPAARLIQAPPNVPAGPRRTRANTPTTPDIRPPAADFAETLHPRRATRGAGLRVRHRASFADIPDESRHLVAL